MEELKPCPFCGGSAWVHAHTRINGNPYYTTHCGICGVSDLKHHKSMGAAIEAWNRRLGDGGYVNITTRCFISTLLRREERVTRERYTATVDRLHNFKELYPEQTQIFKLIEEEIEARQKEHNEALNALNDFKRKGI